MYLFFMVLNFAVSAMFVVFGGSPPYGAIPNFILGTVYMYLWAKNNKSLHSTSE